MGRDRRVIVGVIGATFACLTCLTPRWGWGSGPWAWGP